MATPAQARAAEDTKERGIHQAILHGGSQKVDWQSPARNARG
jgi:hypothetical protein